jgi:hypothetical protein
MVNALQINKEKIAELEEILIKNNQIIPVSSSILLKFEQNDISTFCWKHGIYQLPTTELIEWLQEQTMAQNAIEIGSGNGCIGRNIPVPMYDNHIQERLDIKLMYASMNQPTIKYGKDVQNMAANDAVNSLRPHTVIGCWVTQYGADASIVDSNPFGVKEFDFVGKIKRYIVVGNENVHGKKLIRNSIPHKIIKPNWLVSRSMQPQANCIYDFKF